MESKNATIIKAMQGRPCYGSPGAAGFTGKRRVMQLFAKPQHAAVLCHTPNRNPSQTNHEVPVNQCKALNYLKGARWLLSSHDAPINFRTQVLLFLWATHALLRPKLAGPAPNDFVIWHACAHLWQHCLTLLVGFCSLRIGNLTLSR